MPVLAFIESNTSGTGRLFARVAAGNGVQPVLLAADPARYPYAAEDRLEVLRTDTQDEEALLGVCLRLAAERRLAGVTSSSEYFVATAARLASRLGLSAPRPEAVAACRDKHAQRLRLKAEGVGCPSFRLAESVEEAVAAAAEIGFPVVLKPVYGSGSVGVKLCERAETVAAHARELLSQRQNERGQPVPHRILVEEMATGVEYSVETFGAAVVGVTRKHLGALPSFVEAGHDYPAVLNAEQERSIRREALRALDALDLGWGPAHVELRLTAGGPRIIEVNPRLAGGFIPELVRLASGVDLISATVGQVIGQGPVLNPQSSLYASLRFIIAEREGRLAAITGLDAARRVPGVVGVEIYRGLDERVRVRGDFRDRIGHVISVGQTHEAARAAAETAHAQVGSAFRFDSVTARGGGDG
jgi:argininosuccinate lyase